MDKRIGVVEFRTKGQANLDARQFNSSTEMQAFVDQHRDLAVLDNEGRILKIERGDWDWFIQRWIKTEEQTT